MSSRTDGWQQGPGYCGPEGDSSLAASLRTHSPNAPGSASYSEHGNPERGASGRGPSGRGTARAIVSGLRIGPPLTEAFAPGFEAGAGAPSNAEASVPVTPGQPWTGTWNRTLSQGFGQFWGALSAVCCQVWTNIETRRLTQRRRSLRVIESVGMGEKRFVAIVQVEQARFLIGGGTAGVSLLARLDAAPEFSAVLSEQGGAAEASESASSTSSAGPGAHGPIGTVKVAW